MKGLAPLLVLVAACSSKKAPEQSFQEGMELMCSVMERAELEHVNPAERQRVASEWIDEHVTNREARAAFEAITTAPPAERQQVIADAMKRAGLASCDLAAGPRDGDDVAIDVPMVPDLPLAAVPEGPMLIITPVAIVVEGKQIVTVREGAIDPAELTTKLAAFVDSLARVTPGTMNVAIAPGTPYRVLMQVLYSSKRGYQEFAILARGAGGLGAIPLELPSMADASTGMALKVGEPIPDDAPVGLAVAITKDRILVWSVSGLEGTLRDPKQVLPLDDLAGLQAVLADIHARRPAETSIVVMADADLTAAVVVPLMAAAHASFPDLMLSAGFE